MANTVGTVELQQLKQKHEQKVNYLRLTSPVCARQRSANPLFSVWLNSLGVYHMSVPSSFSHVNDLWRWWWWW